jgi:hypothetical protein
MYHLLYQSLKLHFVFVVFVWFSTRTRNIFLNSVNKLIVVMVKRGILFDVRAEFLSIIQKRFGFKGLTNCMRNR